MDLMDEAKSGRAEVGLERRAVAVHRLRARLRSGTPRFRLSYGPREYPRAGSMNTARAPGRSIANVASAHRTVAAAPSAPSLVDPCGLGGAQRLAPARPHAHRCGRRAWRASAPASPAPIAGPGRDAGGEQVIAVDLQLHVPQLARAIGAPPPADRARRPVPRAPPVPRATAAAISDGRAAAARARASSGARRAAASIRSRRVAGNARSVKQPASAGHRRRSIAATASHQGARVPVGRQQRKRAARQLGLSLAA